MAKTKIPEVNSISIQIIMVHQDQQLQDKISIGLYR